MPNNSTLPATGDVIAAEEIAGAKIQRVKLVLGASASSRALQRPANRRPKQ